MTAQPVESAPRYPRKTLRAIREALPADQVVAFEAARDGLDLDDLTKVAAFRDKWWARAVTAQDHQLDSDSDAGMAGDLALAEPWALASGQ
ncbi:hypothetical protein [Streptomyces sp. NPDC058268]|uniref:hypothetical protein n=1 Tax=Streptomyces sp. NPDC058268 TaxID=3346413 RepID=UPI0036E2D5BB